MRDNFLFDSHVHLNSESLRVWFKSNSFQYENWIFNNVSTNLDDFRIALEQSKIYENVYVTAGIHPLEVENLNVLDAISEIESSINQGHKIIAIGETGFDFYRADKNVVFETQKKSFLKHFELAKKYSLPLMLHIRSAHEVALSVLEELPEHFGIIHCFSGDLDIAKRYLNLKGKWMISISPIVFRDVENYKDVIKNVDFDRLLVETDAPYLSENHTGVLKIIEFIAKQKNVNFEECKKILFRNFCNIFKLKI